MDEQTPQQAVLVFRNSTILLSGIVNKDTLSRLRRFCLYMAYRERDWWQPDLVGYAEHLRAHGLADSTISAHLSTVRMRYYALLRRRDLLYALLRDTGVLPQSPADAKAIVDEIALRIEHAIDPHETHLHQVTRQDAPDSEKRWLTPQELMTLGEAPYTVHGDVPVAWRDSAIILLMASTGLRKAELVALIVDDLYQSVDGHQCVLVRHGKGNKQRLVPYGDFVAGLQATERWLAYLDECGLFHRHGYRLPVFWSFWKDNYSLRGPLSVRGVDRVIGSYPLERDGYLYTISAHDLRRSYARIQYQLGMPLLAIQQNLGHTSLEVTKRYIGQLSAAERAGRNPL